MVSRSKAKRKLNCYLSAPSLSHAREIRNVLNEFNVSVENIESLPPSGESLPSEIRKRIERADFVCGVLRKSHGTTRNFSESVLFELGVAVGCARPIFIIAESSDLIPFSLSSYPVVIGASRDESVMRFHFNAFLKRLDLPTPSGETSTGPTTSYQSRGLSPTRATEHIIDSRPKHRLTQVENIRKEVYQAKTESELSRAIAEALQIAGAHVTTQPDMGDGNRPDMVAWFPAPATDLGAALLVELKSTVSGDRLESAIERVGRYMLAANIRTGLLIASDADERLLVRIVPAGYIFVLSPNNLVELVSRGRLVKDLSEARNKFVHSAM
jgi:hypothetical protein